MQRLHHHERGGASIEAVALSVVVAVLVGAFALQLPDKASAPTSSAIERTLRGLVLDGTASVGRRASGQLTREFGDASLHASDVAARERSDGGNARNWLDAAWRSSTGSVSSHGVTASGAWCALCAGLSTEMTIRPDAAIELRAHLALLRLTAEVSRRWQLSDAAAVDWRASADAQVGANVEAVAAFRLQGEKKEVGLRGEARVGASARAEHAVGVSLGGIAIQQVSAAEGWAGAGAVGAMQVTSENGKLAVNAKAGAALGLGGAVENTVQIDAREFLKTPAGRAVISGLALAARSPSTAVATMGSSQFGGLALTFATLANATANAAAAREANS